jgi:DNA-binding CsgD family transcriptional regulator
MRLSVIELGILIELANRKQSKEIAGILGRSTATVELHVQRLRARFNAQSRAHLVARAFRAGIIATHDIEDSSI